MVNVNGTIIHFGDIRYQHYKDKTGLYKHLDHNDNDRRDRYLKRSKRQTNNNNELTFNNPKSANYHSINILW
jgi:hypothetical protein